MIEQAPKKLRLLMCILLAAITFAVYWPVHSHEFVRYDDDTYVTHNPNVKSGLSWQGIKWAFTTGYASNWHPLTWLSHQLDYTLFAGNSAAHHLVNVLFHAANTLLLFIVLSRMTKSLWPGAFVAALFALHPLHVESVAWVAERKDILSTLFWLLTMLSYARYAERPSAGRYILTLVFFILGLLSKPMLVTLPFILILLDYWPLKRFLNSQFSILNSVLEKVPFIFLAAISSIVTFVVQQKGGAMSTIHAIPLHDRVTNAISSYLVYIGKMVWPARLAVLYPYPFTPIATARAVIYAIILILITIFLIYYGRKYRYLLVGWLWYVITLVPVIGLVQVGAQAMADRYTYVSLTGLFIIISFGAADLLKSNPLRKFALTASALAVLFGCTLVTSAQLKYWKNGLSLFGHTLAVTKDNYVILNNYANTLTDLGRPAESIKYFVDAIKFMPRSSDVRNNYANALRELGKPSEAIEQYKVALQLNPSSVMPHYNLAVALTDVGDYNQAIEQYQITVKLKPDFEEAYCNLGWLLFRNRQSNQAIEYYNKALRLSPNNILVHGRLALALASVGRVDEAIEHCRVVLAARPNDVEMYTNLGVLLEAKGQIEQAIQSYHKALQIDPNFLKAREQLNILNQNQSRH
jgi:tetratricopeptide (TPR) repeat protein